MKKMNKYIWMEVDLLNNEIPLIVADSLEELAEKSGVKKKTISQAICRARKHGFRCRYMKVEINDEYIGE